MNATQQVQIVKKISPVGRPVKVKPPTRRESLEMLTLDSMSVVDQVWLASRRDNIPATFVGFLLGGIVPLMSYMQAHHDVSKDWMTDPKSLLVIGGLIFSFYTVNAWGKAAFNSSLKALGFVVLVEGTMVFSSISWLAIVALVFLITINGIATGVALSLAVHKS